MTGRATPIRIQTSAATGGVMTYLVSAPPETLPSVLPRELERAWHAARGAALAETDGPALLFRFLRGPAETPTDLALTDHDARCWAEAVDAARGLDTVAGLSICLRLLALIDLLSRAHWASGHIALHRDGAEISLALLQAASAMPLNREARFDTEAMRTRLSRNRSLAAMVPPDSTKTPPRP
ncbi:MAG: hypothetical protein P4L66_10370 [Acetobacteraceae bacterium]|nr:hypothetical protein [Acetobacteraceae bacterium]